MEKLLKSLDGKPYPLYKKLKGSWEQPTYRIQFDHIQGDAFAQPSRVRLFLTYSSLNLPIDWAGNAHRQIALRDFFVRRFAKLALANRRPLGSGHSGLFFIDEPGQQVLDTTTCFLLEDQIEIRMRMGLPANGRRILGHAAWTMLGENLAKFITHALHRDSYDDQDLIAHLNTFEDAQHIRQQLLEHQLIAFVGNHAMLARASGISDRPLAKGTTFQSPSSLEITLNRPNYGPIKGMGLKEGIHLIVGGGYHGKSTLLRGIEKGIYNHVPGDGREWVITREDAFKIRAEDGRAVTGVDISSFINGLPNQEPTTAFSTQNASGSTSQAANIIESIQAGSRFLLLDEDTSATNFMIRDRRMQELVAKENEPITPFVDRIADLYHKWQVSVILVMGGSGDYFEKAQNIIMMNEYQPRDVTAEAQKIALAHKDSRAMEAQSPLSMIERGHIAQDSLSSSKGRKDRVIRVQGLKTLTIGTDDIDSTYIEQMVHPSQLRAIGHQLLALESRIQEQGPLSFEKATQGIPSPTTQKDLEGTLKNPDGDLAQFRVLDLCAFLNRLRRLRLTH